MNDSLRRRPPEAADSGAARRGDLLDRHARRAVPRSPRLLRRSQRERPERFPVRKFFYLFTCEYCFSHYVSAGVLLATRFRLLFDDWRGYVVAWLALVWVANHLIGIYGRLRLGIRSERLEIGLKEAVSERAGVTEGGRASQPAQGGLTRIPIADRQSLIPHPQSLIPESPIPSSV